MTVCRGYIRVSTEEQALEGYSLDAQERTLQEAAAARGWTLERVYIDEGKSARQMSKRPGLQQLLHDILRDEVLLVWKLDRLNRNLLDSETVFQALDKKGALFLSVSETHLSSAGPGGKFTRQIMGAVAELYSGMLGENVRHGMTQMTRQGRWTGGPTPFGYDLVGGQIVPNRHAPLVKRIYAMYLQGEGTRSIALRLNKEGYRTRQGAEWASFTVGYIVKNPIYAGMVSFGRQFAHGRYHKGEPLATAKGDHEAIVDLATWELAQEILARRKTVPARQATGAYPLTGITFCALCGSSVGGARLQDRTHKAPRRIYRCNRRSHRGTCTLPMMSAKRLEAEFLAQIQRILDPAVAGEMVGEHLPAPADNDDLQQTTALIADVDRRLARWEAAYEDGDLDLTRYKEKTRPLRQQRRDLVLSRERIERSLSGVAAGDLTAMAAAFLSLWEAAQPAERKELTHQLCQRVVVAPGYSVEVHLRVFAH